MTQGVLVMMRRWWASWQWRMHEVLGDNLGSERSLKAVGIREILGDDEGREILEDNEDERDPRRQWGSERSLKMMRIKGSLRRLELWGALRSQGSWRWACCRSWWAQQARQARRAPWARWARWAWIQSDPSGRSLWWHPWRQGDDRFLPHMDSRLARGVHPSYLYILIHFSADYRWSIQWSYGIPYLYMY